MVRGALSNEENTMEGQKLAVSRSGRKSFQERAFGTRKYCPECIREMEGINVGRRGSKLNHEQSGAAARDELGLEAREYQIMKLMLHCWQALEERRRQV